MKKVVVFITVGLFILAGCKNKSASVSSSGIETNSSSTNLVSLLDTLDLSVDISKLSLQDLRLLRSYPYAMRGMCFRETEIYAYFKAYKSWYEPLIYRLWEEGKLPVQYSDITLPPEERAFVINIDARIAELLKSNYQKQGDYWLGNAGNLVNLYQFTDIDPDFLDKLSQQNFVITESDNLQLFHLYEQNDYRQIPSFITTDLYLQAFHIYFSYILKSLEEQKFISILKQLCLGFYNESMKISEADIEIQYKKEAHYNATFYAIPYYILTGEKLEIPEEYQLDFRQEIENINNESDHFSEFLSFTDAYFPYSLFKPRGHYTRKPEMQAYFKAMMWLQTAPFCREKAEQLKQATFMAFLLNTAQTQDGKSLISLYQSVYEPIVFLIGLPDNLSVMDIADYLKMENILDMETALSGETLEKVDNMLFELGGTRNQIKPKIEITCPDKINFMPQRYLIDNDVLQNLVDEKENAERAFPKGLDVFAAFGSKPAIGLLNNFHKEKDAWNRYPVELSKMQRKFKNYDDWDRSIYNKWIESLLELQKTDKSYPLFMQTPAWDFKNMNTSLASWAELKHDAILYGEQPMTAECGGEDEPPTPILKGYVEPNLKFWNKLSEMITLTQSLLEKHKLLTNDLTEKTEQLSEYVEFLIQVTQKELAKKELDESEYDKIRYMGSTIEHFTLSVLDPDLHLDNWSLVKGPDKSIAVVADIYTRNVPNCSKNGILHVACGNANNIYVVVEMGGYLYLTRGSTFSYYEFVQPLGTRLTDEEWQKMLKSGKAPAVPEWMKSLKVGKEPQLDERIFYSSGC